MSEKDVGNIVATIVVKTDDAETLVRQIMEINPQVSRCGTDTSLNGAVRIFAAMSKFDFRSAGVRTLKS